MIESNLDQDRPSHNEGEEISHDKIFGKAFRIFFKSMVELLHPKIAPLLRYDKVEFMSEPLYADFRKEGHVVLDVVAKIQTVEGKPRIVVLHFEAERTFREIIDDRMEGYIMMLTARHHCPVISAVVFLSGGKPGLHRRAVVRGVEDWECSRVAYVAVGLSRSLAEDWVERPQIIAPALAALMGSKIWDRVEQKLRCLKAIGRATVKNKERFVLATIVETYLKLTSEEEARFQEELARGVHKEVRDMVLTWDEAIAASEARGREKGRIEGMERGMEKGERLGKVAATRQAIVLMLTHRFGSVPGEIRSKLDQIDDLSRLYEILEQAMEIDSTSELSLE